MMTIGHAKAVRRPRDVDQWRAGRLEYIGASEVAAILGLHKHEGPWTVAASKKGILPPWAGNDSMLRGTLHELANLEWFAQDNGLEVTQPKDTLIHPTVDRARCHLDGYVTDGGIVVEAKDSMGRMAREYRAAAEGQLSQLFAERSSVAGYWIQVQTQLAITGRDRGVLTARCDVSRIDVWIDRDDAWTTRILDAIQGFWARYVEGDDMPDPMAGDLRAVKRTYRGVEAGAVLALPDLRGAVEKLRALRAEMKALGTEKKALEARVLAAMGTAQRADIGEDIKPVKRIEIKEVTVPETVRKGYTRLSY